MKWFLDNWHTITLKKPWRGSHGPEAGDAKKPQNQKALLYSWSLPSRGSALPGEYQQGNPFIISFVFIYVRNRKLKHTLIHVLIHQARTWAPRKEYLLTLCAGIQDRLRAQNSRGEAQGRVEGGTGALWAGVAGSCFLALQGLSLSLQVCFFSALQTKHSFAHVSPWWIFLSAVSACLSLLNTYDIISIISSGTNFPQAFRQEFRQQ